MMRVALLCMLEAVKGGLCLLEALKVPEVIRCVTTLYAGGARGDALCATLYAGGCVEGAGGVEGARGAGGNALCATLNLGSIC